MDCRGSVRFAERNEIRAAATEIPGCFRTETGGLSAVPATVDRNKLVTVVLATFNRISLLPRALESLLAQTFPLWEVLVIDDGSTDKTQDVASQYMRRDRRIRVFRQENSGLVSARNAGIGKAEGCFVTFLDSYDEYRPDHLALRVRFMEAHPAVGLIHGGLRIEGGPDTVPDVNDPSRLIPVSECAVGGTFFFRVGALQNLGGFRPPDFGCDHELMQRAIPGTRIEKVDFPTYIYHRDATDSICNLAGKGPMPQ
jgi:glycosyltransferase involved in cell wall biosynthesis